MFLLTFSPFDKIETNRPGNRIKAEGEAVIIPPILCRLVLSKGIKRQNKKKNGFQFSLKILEKTFFES